MGNFAGQQGGVLPSGNPWEYGVYSAGPGNEDWHTGGVSTITPHPHQGSVGARDEDLVTTIRWQSGQVIHDESPEVNGDSIPRPNGATIEDILILTMVRLRGFNAGPARCRENSLAITKIEEALHWLDARTKRRRDDGTEGTYAERAVEP